MAVTKQGKLPQSIFPDLPRTEKISDSSGQINRLWYLSFASLYQALQQNFSNEGIQIPQLTSNPINNQIGYIENIYKPYVGLTLPQNLPNISGKMVYDTYESVPKMFIIVFTTQDDPSSVIMSASWKTFTLT